MITIKKNNFNVKITLYNPKRLDNDFESIDVTDDRDLLAESLARSKRMVLDYAYNNDWDYFVTFTFDCKKIDRLDIKACKDKVLKAFNNYSYRYDPDLKYILIPEFHSDKNSIHFHGLLKTIKNKFITSLFFNKDYHCMVMRHDYFFKRFGANQLIPISHQQEQVGNYICKYMTKGAIRIFDVAYFASKGLATSTKILTSNSKEFEEFILCDVLNGKRPSLYNKFVTQYNISLEEFNRFYKEDL